MPWEGLCEGRQLMVMIRGRSVQSQYTKGRINSRNSPSSGEKRMAETAIYWGSAGGGVAIMLTPLYVPEELEELPLLADWFAGTHSFLWRAQS